jgi:putative spermidine/putrescine transport system permease protein
LNHPRIRRGRIVDLAAHAYVWLCLIVFVLPFLSLVAQSISGRGGTSPAENFQYVFGTFGSHLAWSFLISGLTLMISVAISLPAAYAFVRYQFGGKNTLYTILTLPLYVPGAVIGLSLLLTYNFTYHLTTSMWGLVMAMVVGTFPLMLFPIVVALKDLPVVFEEAAGCLGASKWQTYWKVVFPLIGPGLGTGMLLSFIIVFNDYLVTLFVAPAGLTTAPLQIFNQVQRVGLEATTAALAVTMQVISVSVVLVFFRLFGTRYLKGTNLL